MAEVLVSIISGSFEDQGEHALLKIDESLDVKTQWKIFCQVFHITLRGRLSLDDWWEANRGIIKRIQSAGYEGNGVGDLFVDYLIKQHGAVRTIYNEVNIGDEWTYSAGVMYK